MSLWWAPIPCAILSLAGPASANVQTQLLGALPLRFEAGQPAGASFVANGTNYSLVLDTGGSTLWLRDVSGAHSAKVGMRLIGAAPGIRMEGVEPLGGTTNYLLGSDAGNWKTDITAYGRVLYREPYRGINLVYYGRQGVLEYDFVVQPGADTARIVFELSGVRKTSLAENGDLILATDVGEVNWKRPVIYQDVDGARRLVSGRFVARGHNCFSFVVGHYDRTRVLTIDPTLAYSSYVGSSNNEFARAVAVDGAGDIYIAGASTSPDLAVKSAFQSSLGGSTANFFTGDAFVAKFNPSGALVYLTYLGGSGDDFASSLALDSAGNAYITGSTNSVNFPTTPDAVQPKFSGFGGNDMVRFGDAYVAKISPTGNQLLYSTYFGGSFDDIGVAITLDAAGNIYFAGSTGSPNFPATMGAYQSAFHGSGGEDIMPCCGVSLLVAGDAFVAKLNPAGKVVYATFVGGSQDDLGLALAVDSSGAAYVAGYTLSPDFPTTPGALQLTYGGQDPQTPYYHRGDGFLTKLNPSGSAAVWSTYFGGPGDEWITGIALDKSNNVYFTGATSTQSTFPVTQGAFQPRYAGYANLPFLIEILFGDAFVAKLNPTGSALVYCTYLGGMNNDSGMAIAVDSAGDAYVTGFTDSPNFPVTKNALQPTFAGDGVQMPYLFWGDAFLSVLNPSGTALLYSTFLGGSLDDIGMAVALDANGNVYLAGNSISSDFPVTHNAAQPKFGGYQDVFLALRGDAFVSEISGLAAGSQPSIGGVSNSASYANTAFSPGEAVTIFGQSMGPSQLMGAQVDSATGKLATNLGGAQILFDGVPAPLIYLSALQAGAIVPYEVAGKQTTQAVVSYNGGQSAPFTLNVQATAPGLFTVNQQGTGQAAVYNQDGTVNGTSNPAPVGSIVTLFGTGEGQLKPPGITGEIVASAPPFPAIAGDVSVTIGGVPATSIAYSGPIPSFVEGVFQIDVTIPKGLASGSQSIVVTIGGVPSQSGLTIEVK